MTSSDSRLAILGGAPAFGEKLHVGRPNIADRSGFFERLNDILDTRWLSNGGPYEQELEKRIAEMIGVKHCIAVCNATVALEISIRALGLEGEVLVPSFTFIATAHALQWQRITPVFCDVDPATHNIDPSRIEEMITPRTTGIIGVHLWGRACAIEALEDIASRFRLKLLFDAAHAFACSYKGRMIGCFGDAEVFSFHATKFLNTFEGGAVVTNNDELAGKIRLMKNFGFAGYDTVIYIGVNGKMNEVSAAMGVSSLESLDSFVAANLANYLRYKQELMHTPGIKLLEFDDAERNNYQYIVLEVDEGTAGLSRDELVTVLWAENIIARKYFAPGCHRMEPYRSYYPHSGLLLPVTQRLTDEVLTLPTGTSVSVEQVGKVCGILRRAILSSSAIRARLHGDPLSGVLSA